MIGEDTQHQQQHLENSMNYSNTSIESQFPVLNETLEAYWQWFSLRKEAHKQQIIQAAVQHDNAGIAQLVDLIYTAQANPDKQTRASAEKTLQLIRQQNPILHCEDVLNSLAIETNTLNIAYVVAYTHSLIRGLKQSTVFSNDCVLLSLLALLFIAINNTSLTEKQLRRICSCLPYILDLSCSGQQPDLVMMVVLSEVELRFDSSSSKRFVFIGLSVVEEIIIDVFQNDKMKEVLIQLLKKLSSILEGLGKIVFSDLCNHANTSSGSSSNDLDANLEILKMTGHVLSISMQRISNQKNQLMRVFLENPALLNFFADVIAFDFNAGASDGISLIAVDLQLLLSGATATKSEKVKIINGIKFNSMKSLSVMNNFYLLQEEQAKRDGYDTQGLQEDYRDFLAKYEGILLHMCKQVHLCVSKYDQVFQNYIYEQESSCMQNIDFAVVLISDSVADAKLYKFFANNYADIFHEILLSLICNTWRDYESFADAMDDEFLRLEQDLYCNRESDILKSNGCALIYRLAEYIDGFLAYVINFSVKFIDSVVAATTDSATHSTLEQVSMYARYQHTLFNKLNSVNQVESLLLVLVVLSPLVSNRKDLLKSIQCMFERHFKSFLIRVSEISQVRCSAIVCYYSQYLFSEYDPQIKLYVSTNTLLLSEMMSFLLDQLKDSQRKQQKAVGMVIDTLWKLVNCQSIRGSMESVMAELLPQIAQLVLTCTSEYFFDFVEKVIQNHLSVLRHYATDILKNLCTRVHSEYELIVVSSIKSSLFISKCLHCIVEFAKDTHIMNDFYYYVEDSLTSVLKYLDNPKGICFEDELCELGSTLLSYMRDYDEISDIICRNLSNLHAKNSMSVSTSDQFYLLLVQLFKCEFMISEKPEIISGIFRMCYATIRELNLSNLSCDYTDFLQACYLIQFGLQQSHLIFDNSNTIVSECLEFTCDIYAKFIEKPIAVYPLKYMQIFLVLMTYKAEQTMRAMAKGNIFFHFIDQIEMVYQDKHLEHIYDRKVLFLGVNAIILALNEQPQVQEELSLIIRLLRIVMKTLNWNQSSSNSSHHTNSRQEDSIGYVRKPGIEEIAVENRPKLGDDENWLDDTEQAEFYDITVSDLESERLHNFYYRPERDFYPKMDKINATVIQANEYSLFRETLKKSGVIANARTMLDLQERQALDQLERSQIVLTSANSFEVRQIKKVKRRVNNVDNQLGDQMQVEGVPAEFQQPNRNVIFDESI